MTSPTQASLRLTAWTVIALGFLLVLVSMGFCMHARGRRKLIAFTELMAAKNRQLDSDKSSAQTNPWIQNFMTTFTLSGWYSSKAGYLGLYPPSLLDSFFAKQIVYTWVPLCGIAVLSIWLRHRPFQSKDSTGAWDTAQLPVRKVSGFDKWTRQAKLFFLYQLPPRKFWSLLLDDGFNVIDFVVVGMWIALNLLWMYFSFNLDWPYLVEAAELVGYQNVTADRAEALGYASAWAAVYNLVFVFIPVPRNTFLQYLFNSDFSSIIRYHRWLGHGALWMTLFHGVVFYVSWFAVGAAHFRSQCFAWQSSSVNYLAGSITFFPFGLLLWLGTIPVVRRRFFKVFLSTHIIGFLGFVIFLEIHYPGSIWYMPALAFYFMDVSFRMAQWRITSGVQCTFVSADHSFVTLRLKFNKAAKVKSSQFLFLNVPSVAWFQWHPISIAAVVPGADNLSQDITLHLKAYGKWSQGVVHKVAARGTIDVRVDGPYGHASEPEWTLYDTIVMVAGGIGITPLLSMLREIQTQHRQVQAEAKKLDSKQQRHQLPTQVHLIWAVRNRDELQLLDQELLDTAGLSGSWLKLNFFQTGHKDKYVETASLSSSESDSLSSDSKIPHVRNNNTPITSQLQPYGFGDIHWAVAHVLAMTGAFFGCLLVSAYEFEGLTSGAHLGDGYRIEGIGLLYLLAFIVGSMGLPALIIYPLQIIRYKRHVRACEHAYKHTAHMEWQQNPVANQESKVSAEQAQKLMPDSKAKSGPLDLETGKAATISTGRPNLQRLIAEAVTEHPQENFIGVIASGPPSLVVDAREATHKAGRTARKLGLRGIPELAFSNHSFTL